MGIHDREKGGAEKIAAPYPAELQRAATVFLTAATVVVCALVSVGFHGVFLAGPGPEVSECFTVTGMTVPAVVPSGTLYRSPERFAGPARLGFTPDLNAEIQREPAGFQPLFQAPPEQVGP